VCYYRAGWRLRPDVRAERVLESFVDTLSWVCSGYLAFLLLGIVWNLIGPIISRRRTAWRRNREEFHSFDPVPAPELVVTLVHGTWAMTSRWTRPGSDFVVALQRALTKRGTAAVQFRRFLWSGGNTFAARKIAQDELARDLERAAIMHPGVPHYLVCHSHGGMVALASLLVYRGPAPVRGVACLATPFLIGAGRIPRLTQLLALAFVPFTATTLLGHRLTDQGADGLPRLGLFLVVVAAGAMVGMAAVYLAGVFAARARPTLLPPTPLPDELASRLLIVRSRGDEAIAGLGFGYLVCWAVGRLWIGIARLVHLPFDRSFQMFFYRTPRAVVVQTIAATAIATIGLPILFASEYREWLKSIWHELPVVIGMFMLPGSLLWLFILIGRYFLAPALETVLYVPLTLLLGVFAMPFGPELILSSAYVDISAEPAPVGRHRMLELAGGPADLNHSTYEHPDCPLAIAGWMFDAEP
jgi:hypothetical protein